MSAENGRLREAQEELAQIVGLTKLASWKLLMDIANNQLTTRTNEIILSPVLTLDATFHQEFTKGEVSGIKLFCRFPELLIESLNVEIDTLKGE